MYLSYKKLPQYSTLTLFLTNNLGIQHLQNKHCNSCDRYNIYATAFLWFSALVASAVLFLCVVGGGEWKSKKERDREQEDSGQ